TLTAQQQLDSRKNIYAAPFDAMAYLGLQYNGSCDVSQEFGTAGTGTFSAATRYACDGWSLAVSFTSSGTASATQCLDGPPGYQYCVRATPGVAAGTLAAGDYLFFLHIVEGYRMVRLQWGTPSAWPAMVAFWVKAARAGTYSVAARNFAASH